MTKEQIEYVVWGLLYEAAAETNCSHEVLINIGGRLMEIERSGQLSGWRISYLNQSLADLKLN